jgi:hypothetical protein
MAIGAAASAYFLHGGTAEDAKREFLRVQNGKEAQAEAAAASSSSTLPDAPTGPEADQTAAPAAPDAS